MESPVQEKRLIAGPRPRCSAMAVAHTNEMSFSFEHPNAGGVLLPGQTCCHTGKLIPRKVRGDPLADPLLPELCPKLCSPVGVFPKDHAALGKKKVAGGEDGDESDDDDRGDKENGETNTARTGNDSDDDDDPTAKSGALPLESSPARLAGCAPCGAGLKWSCCNACCGPCTLWSKDGFLAREDATADPTSREYATWDGCTAIPEDAAVPDLGPRDDLGERLSKIQITGGHVSCIAVAPDGTWVVVGHENGAATLFSADPTVDDLGLEKRGVVLPGVSRKHKPKARSFLDSDDEDDTLVADSPEDKETDGQETVPTSVQGGHSGEITCVVFAPDCQSIYTGSRDGTVKRWSLPSLVLQSTFDASEGGELPPKKESPGADGDGDGASGDDSCSKETDDVLAVALSGDGERLYAAGSRTCVVSWDANTGERRGVLFQGKMVRATIPGARDSESDETVPRPAKVEDTSRAARLEAEARVAEDAATAAALLTSRPAKGVPANVVRCLAIAPDAPDGELFITGSRDGAARRWRMAERSCEREFLAHRSALAALATSADGGELITGGGFGDGELRHYRWTPVAGVDQQYVEGEASLNGGAYVRVRTLRGAGAPFSPAHPAGVRSVVLTADERFCYSIGVDPLDPVVQWNLSDGSSKLRIDAPHKGGTSVVCMLPDGVGGKAVPAVRQTGTGNLARAAVERAAAAAKGGRLLTAGRDGFLAVWAVSCVDPIAGATLAARNAQRRNATTATEFQRKQERAARRQPELARTAMAIKARKELPALERSKFPVNPETNEPTDLEDLSIAELELMTSAELLTCCLAHGLLVVNPKQPPRSKREIAKRMFDFFEKERAKAKARMRAERLARR